MCHYSTMLRRMYVKGPMSKSLSDESVDSPKLEKKVTEDVLARKLEERAEAVKLQFFKISQTIVNLTISDIRTSRWRTSS